jgi:uncharacterized protein DUF2252
MRLRGAMSMAPHVHGGVGSRIRAHCQARTVLSRDVLPMGAGVAVGLQEVARAPQVLAVGDLHVGCFGTWRDREGRLCWGIDDFDNLS